MKLTHLLEVYATLGDAVQQLFGGVEPSPRMLDKQYSDQPELAAYLTAKLGMAERDPTKIRKMLYEAQVHACKLLPSRAKSGIESFISRGNGILEAKTLAVKAANWATAQKHFQTSIRHLPTNASTLFLLGMALMERGKTADAVEVLSKSLLLDPDFKAPYVNLGVAYLRLQQYERAIDVSDACLVRHPQTPQCHYHIGAACCQLALFLEAREAGGVVLQEVEELEYRDHCGRAFEAFSEARGSEEGQKRTPLGDEDTFREPPWLEIDDDMVAAIAPPERPTANPRGSASRRARHMSLPPDVGWRLLAWRT